ncbi:uncharacterized protein A4U43_C08F26660 [Asparagus officinalis]|nr:uncharacterized protein A4U43_C08F26660 [Asparagus officinalis]
MPVFDTRQIIERTGVSNGCGMAFWLTGMPPAVVRVTTEEEGDSAEGFSVPEETYVILHKLELDKSWSVHGFLNVTRSEKEAGELPGVLSVVCQWLQEQPKVMKFERDVTMRTNGRMVVWEIGCGN